MLAALFVLASCAKADIDPNKLQVYTSFYAMDDLARQIGGDKIQTHLMCPVGTEPHDYEPKTSDMAKLSEGDVFIYNGAGMEAWAPKAAGTQKNVRAVCASDGVSLIDGSDPHIWLDPKNALKQAENIKNAFAECDSENKYYYEENFRKFSETITALDSEYKAVIEKAQYREIVTAHAAYGYLCSAYGLEQIAIENAQGGEPSPAAMAQIIDTVKEKGIRYICAEELASDKLVQTVAQATGAEIVTLNPFEGDTEGRGYEEIMRANLEVLKKILS